MTVSKTNQAQSRSAKHKAQRAKRGCRPGGEPLYQRPCSALCALRLVLTLGLAAAHGPLPVAAGDPPPAPWTARDLGRTNPTGRRPSPGDAAGGSGASTNRSALPPSIVDVDFRGLWTIRTENPPASPRADSFFLISQPFAGDGSVVALLLGLADETGESGIGVTLRESDAPGARHVLLGMSNGRGPYLRYRPVAKKSDVLARWDRRYGPTALPVWARWQREGDQFVPFASADGQGWTQLHAPITLPRFAASALAGIAAAPGSREPMTALLDNPTIAPGQLSPLVQACAGSGSVLLTWPPVPGAVAYLVRRGAPNTAGLGADLLTQEPIRETSFADANLPNGRSVRYLVSPVFDPAGEPVEGWATAVTVTPTYTPARLFGCDINLETTPLSGTIVYDAPTGAYRITGSGSAVGGKEDRCFFASQMVKGDFQITARILEKPANQAGLMVRESLDGSARMAFLAGTAGRGVVMTSRDKTGAGGRSAGSGIDGKHFKPPLLLRLVRQGARITAFTSADGVTFKPVGAPKSYRPPLPDELYVGYAISSPNAATATANRFTDLDIRP
jgi:hypothetical protein